MKVSDFIFRYKTSAFSQRVGLCRVRIFVNMEDRAIYAVLSELEENPSSSVTNAVEHITSQLIQAEKIPASAIIIDHYPPAIFNYDEFSIVSFDAEGRPSWEDISLGKCLRLLGCTEEEFSDYRSDPRVREEISDAINGISHIQSAEIVENPKITQRRLEIKNSQYRLEDVRRVLNTYPSETDMGKFIQSDMSLLAEVYAQIEDEYICFSEFPVGEGRADFVVFTGRSRMKVFIIEIKGANIPLRRKNHYHSFRASVQEGKDQLEERAKYCQENYEKFRRFVYDVLDEVKKGRRPYNAFLGPKHELQVDSDKDIHISYVLIAGRTSDNLQDSQKRHMTESASNLNIQIETWDSWLAKLRRQ